MKRFSVVLLATVVAAIFIVACGDVDETNSSDSDSDTDTGTKTDTATDTDTDTDVSVFITASAADGPCVAGSVYSIMELDPDTLQGMGTVTDTTNALGVIAGLELKASTPYKILVECGDFNEITGQMSDDQVLLTSFIMTGTSPEQKANVTDISHFLSDNVKAAYTASTDRTYESYLAIKQAAFSDLIGQFGFIVPSADPFTCDPDTLNIVSGSNPCDDIALAVELVVRNYAVANAGDTTPTMFLQTVLDGLKFDFEDGLFSSGSVYDAVVASAPTLDVASAQSNLDNHLAALAATAPVADNVLDNDGNGIPNAADDDIDGDGVANADDEAPYDPTVGGGVYNDVVNGLGWQVTPQAETRTWADSQTYCDSLILGGRDDWRLPSISELRTIIVGCPITETGGECGVTDGCTDGLDADCFNMGVCYSCSSGSGECYWNDHLQGSCATIPYFSSSFFVYESVNQYWGVYFDNAHITYDLSASSMARCVRIL